MMRWCVPLPMIDAASMLELAPVIDAAGYDMITVPDSAFFPETVSAKYPYTADGSRFWPAETPFVEPLVSVAAMAAVTSRVRFVTNVLKTPLREPLLLAKQVASVMVLSGERFELGVGLSWIPEEFAWTGTAMRTRGARLDEQIEILRLICGGGPHFVEHHGAHYDFGRLMVSPAPQQTLRVHVGGHSDAALERAARLGDGWISVNTSSEEILRVVDELARRRAVHGTSDRPFEVNVMPMDIPAHQGGRDGFAALAEQIERAGMSVAFQVLPWWYLPGDPNDNGHRRDALRRFADEVITATQ